MPFVDSVSQTYRYQFEWEREWRVPGGLAFDMTDVAFVIVPDGSAQESVEDLAIGKATYYSHDDLAASFTAQPQPVATAMDQMAAQVLQVFDDPANHLPYDTSEGGYVWLVQKWDSEDAVDYLFQPLEPNVRVALVDYLNGLSPSWVRREEVDGLAD